MINDYKRQQLENLDDEELASFFKASCNHQDMERIHFFLSNAKTRGKLIYDNASFKKIASRILHFSREPKHFSREMKIADILKEIFSLVKIEDLKSISNNEQEVKDLLNNFFVTSCQHNLDVIKLIYEYGREYIDINTKDDYFFKMIAYTKNKEAIDYYIFDMNANKTDRITQIIENFCDEKDAINIINKFNKRDLFYKVQNDISISQNNTIRRNKI